MTAGNGAAPPGASFAPRPKRGARAARVAEDSADALRLAALYVDGARVVLSPERSIATQLAIGSDVMMAMDECVASTSDRETAAAAETTGPDADMATLARAEGLEAHARSAEWRLER